jgi:hypothetical protein
LETTLTQLYHSRYSTINPTKTPATIPTIANELNLLPPPPDSTFDEVEVLLPASAIAAAAAVPVSVIKEYT